MTRATLQGAPELKARMKAVRDMSRQAGADWAKEAVNVMRPEVPVGTGRDRPAGTLRNSIEVGEVSDQRATVVANYTAYFVNAGTKAHVIVPRKAKGLLFEGRKGTIFAKKVNHPRVAAQPFTVRGSVEALRRTPLAAACIKRWNDLGVNVAAKFGRG